MVTVNDLYAVHFSVLGGIPLDELGSGGLDEHDEDQEPDPKTTFAHFGLAYYRASVLEHEIVNILAMSRLVDARQDAEQLLSDPWDDKFKATMGALVKQLETYTHADSELAADLVEALRLRNHLAHAFWRDRAEDFLTEDGRTRMIAYLIKARRHFQDVDQRLTATIGTAALQQWGVTPEVVDAWYHDTLRRVERGELNVPLSTIESTRQALFGRATQGTSNP
jgi:hypothetical protein